MSSNLSPPACSNYTIYARCGNVRVVLNIMRLFTAYVQNVYTKLENVYQKSVGRVDYTNLVYYKVSTNDQVQYAVISWSKLEVQTFNMSRMIKRSFRLIARKLWVELITQAWYRIHCSNDYQRRFSMCPCPCTTIYLTLVFHVPVFLCVNASV